MKHSKCVPAGSLACKFYSNYQAIRFPAKIGKATSSRDDRYFANFLDSRKLVFRILSAVPFMLK